MTCDPSAVCVDNACVDDACVGVVCPTGEVCSLGACGCAADHLSCSGQCVDPTTDDLNCGGCARACPAGQSCGGGTCIDRNCANQACDPTQVCYQNACTDRACVGVDCPTGETCKQGSCGCFGASTLCGSDCRNTQVDSANCGVCGNACSSTDRCAASVCFPHDCTGTPCGPLEVCSGGACVDARCVSVTCPAGQSCSAGACLCNAGLTLCGNTCVDLSTQPTDCGSCGHGCDGGQACSSGNCGINPCNADQALCSGMCVDLSTSAPNCGACGAACGGGRNCVGSQCQCPQGLTLCGTQCTNLETDTGNCGACGNTCNGGTCGTGTPGKCSCPAGKSLCNGTCVDTSSNDLNCGGCGVACGDAGTCVSSACVCPAGQKACNGTCIDVSSDNLNCGGCGGVCQTGKYCAMGSCQLPFTCQSNYNPAAVAACSYFPLLNANCGAQTLVSTQHLVGFVDGGAAAISPFTATPDELFGWFGTVTSVGGAAGWEVDVRTALGQYLTTAGGAVGPTSMPNVGLGAGGSVWPCAQPTDLRIAATNSIAINYDLMFSTTSRERWNTGAYGLAFLDAGLFDHDGGVFCGQLCGDIRKFCGDDRETMSFIIQPGKAADLQMRMWTPSGGANVDVQLYDQNGAFICPLVSNVIVGTTFADYQARVVNNTAQPQRVYVSPWDWGVGANVTWQIAVATEP